MELRTMNKKHILIGIVLCFIVVLIVFCIKQYGSEDASTNITNDEIDKSLEVETDLDVTEQENTDNSKGIDDVTSDSMKNEKDGNSSNTEGWNTPDDSLSNDNVITDDSTEISSDITVDDSDDSNQNDNQKDDNELDNREEEKPEWIGGDF